GSQARNHGPLHFRHVVAESDGVDHLSGPLVVFRIERIDVADSAAHEEENDRLRLGLIARAQNRILEPGVLRELAILRPDRAQSGSKESAPGLREESAPVDAPAGIERGTVHAITSRRGTRPY